MATFKIYRSNSCTGKSNTKMIQAEDVRHALFSKEAMSNYMMANAWGIDQIDDEAGVMVWHPSTMKLS